METSMKPQKMWALVDRETGEIYWATTFPPDDIAATIRTKHKIIRVNVTPVRKRRKTK